MLIALAMVLLDHTDQTAIVPGFEFAFDFVFELEGAEMRTFRLPNEMLLAEDKQRTVMKVAETADQLKEHENEHSDLEQYSLNLMTFAGN